MVSKLSNNSNEIRNYYEGLFDGPHATPKESAHGPVFLGIKNITEDGHLDFSEVKHISYEEYPKWTKRVVPKEGDIVFVYEATLNRYALIPKDFEGCLGRRLALIRPDKRKIVGKYLYYYFYGENWRKVIQENTIVGSTVDRIPIAKFPEFNVLVPGILAQKKIASILSAYDDLVENNNNRITKLEEMMALLFKKQFPFTLNQNLPQMGGLIIKGWEKGKINDLVTIKSGYAFKSKDFLKVGNLGIVTIKNVQDGYFIENCDSYMESIPGNMPTHCILHKSDMLLSLTGNVGRVCLVIGEKFLLNQRVAKLEPKKENNLAYIYCLFRHKEFQNKLISISKGVAQQNLSPIELGNIALLIPPAKDLSNFNKTVLPMISLLVSLKTKNNLLLKSKKLLLPKLISGEINVENLDIKIRPEIL